MNISTLCIHTVDCSIAPHSTIVNIGSHILSICLPAYFHIQFLEENAGLCLIEWINFFHSFQARHTHHFSDLNTWIPSWTHWNNHRQVYRFFCSFCNPSQVIHVDTNECLHRVSMYAPTACGCWLFLLHNVFHLSTTLGVKDMYKCVCCEKTNEIAKKNGCHTLKNRRIDCLFCFASISSNRNSQHTDTHTHTSLLLPLCANDLLNLSHLSSFAMRQYCRLFLTRVEAIQCELMCIMHHCVCSTLYGHVVHRNSHVCMCTPVGFRSSNAHTNVQLQNRTVTLAYTKILFFKVFSVRFVRSYLWGKGVRGWKKIVLRYTSPICVCLNERFFGTFSIAFVQNLRVSLLWFSWQCYTVSKMLFG